MPKGLDGMSLDDLDSLEEESGVSIGSPAGLWALPAERVSPSRSRAHKPRALKKKVAHKAKAARKRAAKKKR